MTGGYEATGNAPLRLVTREFMQDPYPALQRIRTHSAAVPIDTAGLRAWVVTRFDDARNLLVHPDIKKDIVANQDAILHSSVLRPEKLRGVPLALRRHMLDRDEPDHTRMRSLVSGYFTGAAVASLRPAIEEKTRELLSDISFGETIDLLDSFCRPLARSVIAKLLGIPADDRSEFPNWVNALLTSLDKAELKKSAALLVSFIEGLLSRKSIEPGDDIATAIAAAAAEGTLTDVEAIASVHVLLTGGLEPMNGIANAVYCLLNNPEQLAALRDNPTRMANCIDESLRYESPFRMLTPRYACVPVDLGDALIPANEMILISPAAAGRDPGRFGTPDTFDLNRNAKVHLGFGRGMHRCLGASLARLEMEIALSALLTTAPGIRLADTARRPFWQPGIFMRRLQTLPVVLGR